MVVTVVGTQKPSAEVTVRLRESDLQPEYGFLLFDEARETFPDHAAVQTAAGQETGSWETSGETVMVFHDLGMKNVEEVSDLVTGLDALRLGK